jgi:hypothetical protein
VAALNIKATFCPGGGHAHVTITGAKTASIALTADEMRIPLTQEEAEIFARIALRLRNEERTLTQIKTSLAGTGIAISVTG